MFRFLHKLLDFMSAPDKVIIFPNARLCKNFRLLLIKSHEYKGKTKAKPVVFYETVCEHTLQPKKHNPGPLIKQKSLPEWTTKCLMKVWKRGVTRVAFPQ